MLAGIYNFTVKINNKLNKKVKAFGFITLALIIPNGVIANDTVTIAYQYGPAPAKWAQAEGRYEQATGRNIVWKKFETGADIAIALTSGDVDIGLIGSTPLAAFTSRGLQVKLFFLDSVTGQSEALVVRDEKIKTPEDLNGKTIATPFVSTSHFALLAALKHWGIDLQQTRIVNLGPAEIIATWQRGDIDAAYTWDPALSAIQKLSGTVLTDSAEVARWGSPTFNSWVARTEFADKNPEFLQKFTEVSLQANREYRQNLENWTVDSVPVKAIASISGSLPHDVITLIYGNDYKEVDEQLSEAFFAGGLAQILADTAQFLKEQKTINRTLEDYSTIVDDQYLKKAAQP